jgi:hypothetical protein
MNGMAQPKMTQPPVFFVQPPPKGAYFIYHVFHLIERISVQDANLPLWIEFRRALKQKLYSQNVRGSLSAFVHGDIKGIGHLALGNDNRLNPLTRPCQLKRFLIVF